MLKRCLSFRTSPFLAASRDKHGREPGRRYLVVVVLILLSFPAPFSLLLLPLEVPKQKALVIYCSLLFLALCAFRQPWIAAYLHDDIVSRFLSLSQNAVHPYTIGKLSGFSCRRAREARYLFLSLDGGENLFVHVDARWTYQDTRRKYKIGETDSTAAAATYPKTKVTLCRENTIVS